MRVWLSDSCNPRRKYRYSLELVEPVTGQWVGVNTQLPNQLVREAIELARFPDFTGYVDIKPEVPYGTENSRVDLLLRAPDLPDCYVEIKNVTWCQHGRALFPDAVTARGTRHLRELMHMRAEGHQAAVVFCIQHSAAECFSPAASLDPAYARALREAERCGVRILAWQAAISPQSVELVRELPVLLNHESIMA